MKAQYFVVLTSKGPFQFRYDPEYKPFAPGFGTDAFACDCPQAWRCYARAIQLRNVNADKRWKRNQATLDALTEARAEEELVDLFRTGLRWARLLGQHWFRGWVSGDPTEFEARALVRAAGIEKVRCWIPSATFGQNEVAQRSRWAVVRNSTGYGPHRSVIVTKGEPVPAGMVECKEDCRNCRACWNPRVEYVAYHERPYTGKTNLTRRPKHAQRRARKLARTRGG